MAEQRNRWNWEVPGFEFRNTFEHEDHKPPAPMVRRYSVSSSSVAPHSDLSKHALASKLQRLQDKVKVCIFSHCE